MLVLTRKSNQSIMIGDDIEVSVLAVMGEKVRIGISAPRDVPVFRKEVYLEIKLDQTDDSDQRAAVAKALAELKGNSRPRVKPDRGGRRPVSDSLAHDSGEHLEHHDGHDHRGRDDRRDEQQEAGRTRFARALPAAFAGARRGLAPQPLRTLTFFDGLLGQGSLELGVRAPHSFRAYSSGRACRHQAPAGCAASAFS
jgi:carbon storage regulator